MDVSRSDLFGKFGEARIFLFCILKPYGVEPRSNRDVGVWDFIRLIERGFLCPGNQDHVSENRSKPPKSSSSSSYCPNGSVPWPWRSRIKFCGPRIDFPHSFGFLLIAIVLSGFIFLEGLLLQQSFSSYLAHNFCHLFPDIAAKGKGQR
ncbi:hypothetical protein MRB53_031370 [Persea americana]|uniref:Uncharacterized protein n=1 Tax=Persea americana TaxID=3435 RepID=A0ACC2KNR3_PERAE|nr:hypothetical protein MRB53_031370 [Persea americana]